MASRVIVYCLCINRVIISSSWWKASGAIRRNPWKTESFNYVFSRLHLRNISGPATFLNPLLAFTSQSTSTTSSTNSAAAVTSKRFLSIFYNKTKKSNERNLWAWRSLAREASSSSQLHRVNSTLLFSKPSYCASAPRVARVIIHVS